MEMLVFEFYVCHFNERIRGHARVLIREIPLASSTPFILLMEGIVLYQNIYYFVFIHRQRQVNITRNDHLSCFVYCVWKKHRFIFVINLFLLPLYFLGVSTFPRFTLFTGYRQIAGTHLPLPRYIKRRKSISKFGKRFFH